MKTLYKLLFEYPLVAILLAGFVFASCLYYIYVHATMMPSSNDVWPTQIEFLINYKKGPDWHAFFTQHNEHRIAIAKLFYLIDELLFPGNHIFLYLLNILFPIIFIVFMWRIIAKEINFQKNIFFFLIIIVPIFFLSQNENFSSSSQGIFFLSYVIPLIIYFYWICYKTHKRFIYLGLVIFLSVLAPFTMASGVFSLFPIIIYSLIDGTIFKKRSRIVILFLFSIQFLILYFYLKNHIQDPTHGHMSITLLKDPLHTIYYAILYLGSPFGKILAIPAALCEVIYVFYLLSRSAFRKERLNYSTALLLFILFVFITSALTAIGRANFGLDTAFFSRYTTPAIYALVATIALFYVREQHLRRFVNIVMLILSILIITVHLNIIKAGKPVQFFRYATLISAVQGTTDEANLKGLFYPWRLVTDTIKEALETETGIFATEPYQTIAVSLNKPFTGTIPENICQGNIDQIVNIGNDGTQRVQGWIHDPQISNPYYFLVAVQDGTIRGHGITGELKPDLKKAHGKAYAYSGFWLYLHESVKDGGEVHIFLLEEEAQCKLTIPIAR